MLLCVSSIQVKYSIPPNFWQYQNPQEEIHNEMNSGTKIYFCILRNHIEFLMDDFKLMQIIHYGGCDSGKTFSDTGSTETNQGEDEEDNKIDLTFLQKVC